jgi:1-acyl-sn-glycerol-3-phosphate acyltransferase
VLADALNVPVRLTSRSELPKLVTLMLWLWIILALIAAAALLRLVVLPWLSFGTHVGPTTGFIWRLVQVYARFVHRVRFEGMDEWRRNPNPGPLIVVSNHTGSVDPLLIQSGCHFHIRWMMASEMIAPWLRFVWKRTKPIPVDRDGRDSAPAREAIRHVRSGGVLGIFPEGRIVRPPQQIRPFFLGVGLIVARAKAPVLLVWVSGTPDTPGMMRSLFTPSRARVVYIDLIDFSHEPDAHIITQRLRERIAQVSGWPVTDEPQPPSVDVE